MILAIIYITTFTTDGFLLSYLDAYPYLLVIRFALWTLHTFSSGLVLTGLWVVAHECGHDAFSEHRWLNTTVGWLLHSSYVMPNRILMELTLNACHLSECRLGVPYNAFRITHAMHHASNGHMTKDQVFVPRTRSQLGLPPLDPTREDVMGSAITDEVMEVLWDALGDSPLGAMFGVVGYLVCSIAVH